MRILSQRKFIERTPIHYLILQFLKYSVFASTEPITCNFNNTIIPWVDISYGFSSLNSKVNDVEIRISASTAFINMDHTYFYIAITKESEPILERVLKSKLQDSSIQTIVVHNRSIIAKKCIADINHRTLTKQVIYLNVKINSADNLKLIIINTFNNLTECCIYEIRRPNLKWCYDLLRAGGLVLALLCPTILYIMYRFIQESYVRKTRLKKIKERNSSFHLYVLSEETTDLERI
ncbi:hypothetical protein Trydic_g4503 [Trypoxylus dichotomus]